MEKNPGNLMINQAAQWYARLRAPDCGPTERHAFQRWLESDPAHAQAYESAARAARLISSGMTSDPRLQALAQMALDECASQAPLRHNQKPQRQLISQRQSILRANMRYAAALFIAVGIGLFLATLHTNSVVETAPAAIYANNSATIRRVELSDGSVVHLDVGSSVAVNMSSAERQIKLDKGRAFFDVASDTSRPFAVTASSARVVALGTQFQVEVLDEQVVNVTLAEGSVAVTESVGPGSWREVLSPGQQLQIDKRLGQHKTLRVDTSVTTSWSSGRLVFDGMPLDQVLNEINRYSSTKVILGDGALANIPIGGNFVAGGDSSEFVETLTAALPLRSVRTGANEIVLFQRYETDSP